jgi:sodium-dependent phosphate cotransporter
MNNKKNKEELKEELAEKKEELAKITAKAKSVLEKTKNKIENKKEIELKEVEEKKDEALKEIEKEAKKVWKIFTKKKVKINKEAEKANKNVEKVTAAEIAKARKELISVKARVYSTRRKVISFLQLVGVLYLFILSVIIIKEVTLALSAGTVEAIAYTVDNNVSAFGAGWLTTVIAQSGSVIAILANSLVGAKIMSFDIGFYILLGISLGNPLTPVLASLVIRTKDHWQLRRGFELGLANIVYSIFLIIIILLIEIPTGFFTNSGEVVARWAANFPAFKEIPDLLSIITSPLLNLVRFDLWPIPLGILVGIGLLIFSLGRVGKSVFIFLGGRKHARAIMEKFLGNHWKAFGIGLGLTIIIPSASLLTTIMVPLAVAQIVRLKQAIPYLIGTSVATFIDVLFASFANSQPYAIAGGVVLSMLAALGVIFIFGNYGCTLVYKTTKYLSTHVIKMRRGNILKYIAGFALIPILLILIF